MKSKIVEFICNIQDSTKDNDRIRERSFNSRYNSLFVIPGAKLTKESTLDKSGNSGVYP